MSISRKTCAIVPECVFLKRYFKDLNGFQKKEILVACMRVNMSLGWSVGRLAG